MHLIAEYQGLQHSTAAAGSLAHEQRAAGIAEREVRAAGKRDPDLAKNDAEADRERKGSEPDRIKFEEFIRKFFLNLDFVRRLELLPFFFHIGAKELRDKLDEKDDADNAERIADRVTDGAHIPEFLGRKRVERGGETGRRGERTGKNADDHGAVDAGDLDNRHRRERRRSDDHEAQKDVRRRVALEVREEFRTGDEADARHEAEESEILNRLHRGFQTGGGNLFVKESVNVKP